MRTPSLAARRVIGIVAIALLAAFTALAVTRPENPFADRTSYYAVFDTANGLGPIDRDVRVAGVKVGSIGDVERVGDDVRVELRISGDVTLHDDARAAMRPHTLFEGSNFVDVELGSPSAPVMDSGDEIPRVRTTNYVSLDQALRVLRPDVRKNLQVLARVGSRTLRGETITGTQRLLRTSPALVTHLAPAARAAQGTNGTELAGAIRGLSLTVDALESRSTRLLPLIRETDRTAAALTVDGGAPLDATLAALPGTLAELRRTAPLVAATLTKAGVLSSTLAPALPELTTGLRAGTPVVERTIPVARAATPVVRDARLIAARLAAARRALVEMFGLASPSLDKFDSLFAVFNKPTALGAPTGVAQLVGGAFSGLNAVFRPFQTRKQSASAPGHTGRIGVFVDPTGLASLGDALGGAGQTSWLGGGALPPPCTRVATVSPRAAGQIRAIGGCR